MGRVLIACEESQTVCKAFRELGHEAYSFGDPEMKETCLWLNRLPRLQGLHEVALNINKYHPKPESSRIGSDGKMKNKYFMQRAGNAKNRSKTFPGIARAMAEQWGKLL